MPEVVEKTEREEDRKNRERRGETENGRGSWWEKKGTNRIEKCFLPPILVHNLETLLAG